MRYPAKFEPAEEGGFVVSFRDIPEAITQGEDFEDARYEAADALQTAMEIYLEDRRQVPLPSPSQMGEVLIDLPLIVGAKVALLNELLEQRVSNSELARRMNTTPQNVNRLTTLRHQTRIDTVNEALKALGKQIDLTVSSV